MFDASLVEFLGMVIQEGIIAMDPTKLSAIATWEPPMTVHAVRSFIGFCNFYHKFIPNFSGIARPILDLTKKGQPWSWTHEQQRAFDLLHQAFTSKPVLTMPDTSKPFFVMIDTSLMATGGVLLQKDANSDLHPCCYIS